MRTNSATRSAIEDAVAHLVEKRTAIQGHHLEVADVARFVATLLSMPDPPCSLLDVGCGTGILADVARELGYEAAGVDTDPEVIKQMTAASHVASIGDLPFPDAAFDVSTANEVLEHLPASVFPSAVAELARVTRSRVVITVPNAESLESASTRCPECRATYSIHGHVRRFDRTTMASLIPGFTLTDLREVGPYKVRHRTIEWIVRRRLLGRWPAQPGATCPQCGWRQLGERTVPMQGTITYPSRILRLIAGVPWARWWFVAAYDRTPPP